MSNRDLVDVREAVKLTGLDKATLYRLARHGQLRSFRVLGRALRFERVDLLDLAKENTKPWDGEKNHGVGPRCPGGLDSAK